MAETGKTANMMSALRKRANALLPRFSPKSEPALPEGDKPLFQSFDPTTALFPGQNAEDERAGSLPLSTVLEDAAHAMARRKIELNVQASKLASLINQRREGEMTLAAQGMRVLIGLGWAGIAGWLYLGVLNARADGIGVIDGGVPLDDATVLMRTFTIVAMAALGVAFAVAALTRGLGNADNSHITREAERLGRAIADASDEFDATLSALRKAMDQRGHPADAVDELARAHVTALEAHDFFREINFLNGAEDEHARRMFKGFLSRTMGGSSGGAVDYLITFAAGLLAGAIVMHFIFAPEPVPVTDLKSAVAVTSYPWAMQIIILGGLLYAAIGALLSLFSGPMTEGVADKARAEALTALRSGFAARNALRPADVTRRIKDAVDVFRARVRGGAGGNAGRTQNAAEGLGANQSSDFSGDDEVPQWRRRDSSVKFVDTGFSPAPESWRTDAYAKKFEAPEPGKTGSKRDGEVLKNRSRD